MQQLAPDMPEHEEVVVHTDPRHGLTAIIAIYSTALGPALGGTRFYPYPDEEAALADVLDLSKAMAYKAACAGLAFGGGKAVIVGDPATDKSEGLLRAYGRLVAALDGRYITACDVGTYVRDMDVVARECRWVTGRSPEHGGAGDSAVLTAFGVLQGMLASAEWVWGVPSVRGRRVGVLGVGKVGRRLVGLLAEQGARIVVADVHAAAAERVRAAHAGVEVVDPDALPGQDVDIFAPCALGGALDDDTVAALQARIVCGAANNQLARPGVEKLLADRGILYAPDYVVNAGGLIQVADEVGGYRAPRARAKAAEIYATTRRIFALATDEGVPPAVAADRLAEQRMREARPARPRGVFRRTTA